jgi:hypothetical protein
MENETTERPPILDIAWKRFAIFDAAASRRTRGFYRIRSFILWTSVAATLFAILITVLPASPVPVFQLAVFKLGLKFLFIATPIVASFIAAFATRFYSNGSWLIMRAGAEEIKKEIYLYRTTRDKSDRDEVLENKLANIQRQMYQSLNGEFFFEEYKGEIPPYYNPNEPDENKRGDPGFHDLTGEEYFRLRLEDQFNWHNKKINMYREQRRRMVIYILAMGGLGAIIAAWGEGLSILVALTAAITTALIGWQELNNYDAIIGNYSKVVVELTILYDHWKNLQPEERQGAEFVKTVDKCEGVLWAQHKEYIRVQQEVLQETEKEVKEKAKLAQDVLDKAVETAEAAELEMRDSTLTAVSQALDSGKEELVGEFNATLGKLAEEASSDLVKQELEAMRNAVEEAVATIKSGGSLREALENIVNDYKEVEIGRDTTREQLNQILARYPKTNDVKG